MSHYHDTPRSFPPSPYRPIVSQLTTLCTILALTTLAAVAAITVTMLTQGC